MRFELTHAQVMVVEYSDAICGGIVDGETATAFHKILQKQARPGSDVLGG